MGWIQHVVQTRKWEIEWQVVCTVRCGGKVVAAGTGRASKTIKTAKEQALDVVKRKLDEFLQQEQADMESSPMET